MPSNDPFSSCPQVNIRSRRLHFLLSSCPWVLTYLFLHLAISSALVLPLVPAEQPLPSCVILDLDHTLWNRPRFRKGLPFVPLANGSQGVQAASGETLDLFPNVREILPWLIRNDIQIGFVSSTHRPQWAQYFLENLRIQEEGKTVLDFCKGQSSICIQDGPKVQHIRKLSRALQIKPEEVLFFDDNFRQIQRANQSGIISVHCPNGLCWERLEEGLNVFAKQKNK